MNGNIPERDTGTIALQIIGEDREDTVPTANDPLQPHVPSLDQVSPSNIHFLFYMSVLLQ